MYKGAKATAVENHAIEMLTDARRVARERRDDINENHASLTLGIVYAGRKNFRAAKNLLPTALYRRILRGGRAEIGLSLAALLGDYYD